jgi:hypothetical protein
MGDEEHVGDHSPEIIFHDVEMRMNKNYKKRRRKKDIMWKYASSLDEFYIKREEDEAREKTI